MEVTKYWSELLSAMTEDDNARVRAGDEKELRAMPVEEFFIKALVFKERIQIKIDQLKKTT